MRIIWILAALCLTLSGCGAQEVFETVADNPVQAVSAQPRALQIQLAGEPVLPAMESDGGTLYICDGYDVMTQILEAGDLGRTVQTLSGYEKEALTVMQTEFEDCKRYDFVWTAATDGGEQLGRACILDDGSYHYCLSAITGAENGEEYREIWNGIFESITLG